MVTMRKYCSVCKDVKEMKVINPVEDEKDTYVLECDRGHISEFFVPESIMKLLEEKAEFDV